MQINRTYHANKKIAFSKLFQHSIYLIIFCVIVYFLSTIYIPGFTYNTLLNTPLPGLLILIGIFALYTVIFLIIPFYINYQYYLRDKNVSIFIDYIKEELHYIVNNKTLRIVKFSDIVEIETYCRRYRRHIKHIHYHLIILKQNESIIVTSSVIPNMHKVFPEFKNRGTLWSAYWILPKSVPSIIKGRFERG